MTIGSAKVDGGGLLTAAKARETAGNLLAKVKLGHDPAGDRALARVRASDEALGDVIGRFLTRQERRVRLRTYVDTKRYLERYWKPLHPLHLDKISRATVAARLGKIAADHGPVSADRARAALSAFFTWAIGEGLCEVNPVIGTNKQGRRHGENRRRCHRQIDRTRVARATRSALLGTLAIELARCGSRRGSLTAPLTPERSNAAWTHSTIQIFIDSSARTRSN
jgi:hypothetical protein